ncbi:MAG: TetR/AcrR family transcriptional regulator [Bacteroidales bacterium]|nr:TetR/AcrR family transcriptional regulator [Bacteroidales bacterium]
MSPRTEIQFEEIRKEKRKLIMDTALQLFAEEGFHSTTISMIAKKADISKGLLYNYFESKEILLKEIMDESVDILWRYFDPNKDGILTKEEFVYFIHQTFHVVKNNQDHWRLYSALMFQPRVLKLIEHNFENAGQNIMKLLFEFFKTCGCEDPEGEILIFSSLLKGAVVQYLAGPNIFPLEYFEEKIIAHYKQKLKL